MGGGASRRAKMLEEVENRVTTISEDTAELVRQDRERILRHRSATKIQARHRGRSGRKVAEIKVIERDKRILAHQEANATMIQKQVRGVQARYWVLRAQAGAATIQRCWRGKAARNEMHAQKGAAMLLQNGWRSKTARHDVALRRKKRAELVADNAATVLQVLCRRMIVAAMKEELQHLQKLNRCACMVQRHYRWVRANGNWAAAVRVSLCERSAKKLQKWWRSFHVRLRARRASEPTNAYVKKLLEEAGLSRLWPKWGPDFTRNTGVTVLTPWSTKARPDAPPARDGTDGGCYGGWALSYEQTLALVEWKIGGKGLKTPQLDTGPDSGGGGFNKEGDQDGRWTREEREQWAEKSGSWARPGKSWTPLPLSEWGLPSADRARLVGKIKSARPKWKAKLKRDRETAERRRIYELENRDLFAATRIQKHARSLAARMHVRAVREVRRKEREDFSGWKHVMTDRRWRDKAEAGLATEERLRRAARRGDKTQVAALLATKSDTMVAIGVARLRDVDAPDEFGRAAFTLACLEGHQQLAKILLKAGADPEHRDNDGATAFLHACHEGQMGVVRWLHADVKVDTEAKCHGGAAFDSHEVAQAAFVGATPLMTACHAGMMNVVAYLCETAGTDKHTRTQNGVTPFFTVCYTGNLRMVKYLIRCGFDTRATVTTDKGVHRTPIEIAESRLVETGDPKFEEVIHFVKRTHAKEEAKAEEAERKRLEAIPKPKKEFVAPEDRPLNISRAEIRAIELWLEAEELNPFGDPRDHIYVRMFKGEYMKADYPNGYDISAKMSRMKYITKENPLCPWARFRPQAKKEADALQGGWRRGKGAFAFGNRAASDGPLAATVEVVRKELGIEIQHHHRPEDTPLQVAHAAADAVIPHTADHQIPTRADAIAGRHPLTDAPLANDNGADDELSYLEMLDLAARVVGHTADWTGRGGWIERGGRTHGELREYAMKIWLAIEETVEVYKEPEEVSAQFRSNFGGLTDAKMKFRKAGNALTFGARMVGMADMLKQKDAPARKLVTPLMKLPDRMNNPAYYDIVRCPIDMGMIRKRIEGDKYSSVLAFRNDVQTLFFNGRVMAGRGTQLWDDLTVMEDAATAILDQGRTRLPPGVPTASGLPEEEWPEWNTIPPEIGIQLISDLRPKECSVQFEEGDTLQEVKQKIRSAKKNSGPVEGRRFLYKGSVLDERTPLPELGIEPGMTLQLEPFLVVRMPHAEDSEEVQRLNAVWMRVDADGSGALDLDEMRAVFAELGEELSDEELLEKFQMLDEDGSGFIEKEEFTAWWVNQDMFQVAGDEASPVSSPAKSNATATPKKRGQKEDFFFGKPGDEPPEWAVFEKGFKPRLRAMEPGTKLILPLGLMDKPERLRAKLRHEGVDSATFLLYAVDPRRVVGDDETLGAAGVEPGGAIELFPEPVEEEPPLPSEMDAATLIQGLARGWRARTAVGYALGAGTLTKALFRAAMSDDPALLSRQVAHCGDRHDTVDARNGGGHSLLAFALERGKLEVVAWLEASGAADAKGRRKGVEEEILDETEGTPRSRPGTAGSRPRTPGSARSRPGTAGSRQEGAPEDGEETEELWGGSIPVNPADAWASMTEAEQADFSRSQLEMFSAHVSQEAQARPRTAPEMASRPGTWRREDLPDGHSHLQWSERMEEETGDLDRSGFERWQSFENGSSLEPGGVRRRPKSAIPMPRLLAGAFASLSTEPLFLERDGVKSAQTGPDLFYDRRKGNLPMHHAIGRVSVVTKRPKRPRMLKPPTVDPRMATSNLVKPEDSISSVMSRFERASQGKTEFEETLRRTKQLEEDKNNRLRRLSLHAPTTPLHVPREKIWDRRRREEQQLLEG